MCSKSLVVHPAHLSRSSRPCWKMLRCYVALATATCTFAKGMPSGPLRYTVFCQRLIRSDGGLERCSSPNLTLCSRGHALYHGGHWFHVYCFKEAVDAQKFMERFGGEKFDPIERGRGADWARWKKGYRCTACGHKGATLQGGPANISASCRSRPRRAQWRPASSGRYV